MTVEDPENPDMSLEEFRKSLTRPPIERRSFVTYLDVDKPTFDQKANQLLERLQQKRDFGNITVRKHWEFSVQERPGGILVPKGKVTNILRMERDSGSDMANAVVELVPPRDGRPAEFMVGHKRNDESPTVFEDLRSEIDAILPDVFEILEVKGNQGLMLRYTNKVTHDRYPNLWVKPGHVKLSDLFKIFGTGTGGHTFRVPFRVEYGEQAPCVGNPTQKDPHAGLDYLATAEATEKKEFAFLVVLTYSSLRSRVEYTTKTFWPALDWAHIMILKSFNDVFADKAMAEFKA